MADLRVQTDAVALGAATAYTAEPLIYGTVGRSRYLCAGPSLSLHLYVRGVYTLNAPLLFFSFLVFLFHGLVLYKFLAYFFGESIFFWRKKRTTYGMT